MESILSCQDITFSYPAPEGSPPLPPIFEHLDFEVGRGRFVTVLGHNGSGKSTLAKHLNAILLPSGGKVYVGGLDTADEEKLLAIRKSVGMVFQNPDNQIVATVVEEDVAFGPENLGVPPAEIRERVDDALKSVGMYEFRTHAPHQLSGGQKQRIAIAGVIAMRPDCVVLDEPTAMLDPRGRREVLATIKKLNREFGVTVVLITHFMDEAAESERVVVMDNGKIILDDVPEIVFSHVGQLRSVGLDVPQATELCYELRAGGLALPDDIITEDACVEAVARALGKGGVSGEHIELVEPEREERPKRKAILKTEELTYLYSQGTPFEKAAIRDVNLEIEEGAFVGIIGHTGSGKSTLIQHFNGLLRPHRGKVYVDGEDIWAEPKRIRRFRFKVGLVFQYPEYQLFEETVFRDIAFGPRNMGLSEEEVRYRVKSVAELVELKPSVMEQSPFELSGGQKRRVALAGVMAMTPDVLVLDEPTAGLDPRGRDRILGEIREYHRQQKNTILLVSHSMEDVAKYAEKALVMNESEIYLYDDVARVFAHAGELGRMGLAVPQVTRISAGLHDRGYAVSPHTYTVERAREQILALSNRANRAGRGGA